MLALCFVVTAARAADRRPSAAPLEGTWADTCTVTGQPTRTEEFTKFVRKLFRLPVIPYIHSAQITITYSKGRYLEQIRNFTDNSCRRLAMSYEFSGTYSLGRPISNRAMPTAINYSEKRSHYRITFFLREAAEWANRTQFANHVRWGVGIPKYVKAADETVLEYFDLLEVRGDRLYRGEEKVGLLPQTRPQSIGRRFIFFRRQS